MKKRHVTLDVGAKSRSKVVVVASSCGVSAEDIYDKLLQASNEVCCSFFLSSLFFSFLFLFIYFFFLLVLFFVGLFSVLI